MRPSQSAFVCGTALQAVTKRLRTMCRAPSDVSRTTSHDDNVEAAQRRTSERAGSRHRSSPILRPNALALGLDQQPALTPETSRIQGSGTLPSCVTRPTCVQRLVPVQRSPAAPLDLSARAPVRIAPWETKSGADNACPSWALHITSPITAATGPPGTPTGPAPAGECPALMPTPRPRTAHRRWRNFVASLNGAARRVVRDDAAHGGDRLVQDVGAGGELESDVTMTARSESAARPERDMTMVEEQIPGVVTEPDRGAVQPRQVGRLRREPSDRRDPCRQHRCQLGAGCVMGAATRCCDRRQRRVTRTGKDHARRTRGAVAGARAARYAAPAASLVAETSLALFRVAYVRWIDSPGGPDLCRKSARCPDGIVYRARPLGHLPAMRPVNRWFDGVLGHGLELVGWILLKPGPAGWL